MAVLIKIRFEFTLLFEPQNDVKIEFISIQARGGLLEGGGWYNRLYFFVYRYVGL